MWYIENMILFKTAINLLWFQVKNNTKIAETVDQNFTTQLV